MKHPATRDDKWSSLRRFAGWQFQSRVFKHPQVYPFIENSKLLVQGGMTGATGNIYTGLHEFEDMMFSLHLLRPGDLFVDVGANIGSYSVLASAVAGARTVSFEPVPSTFLHLKHNISINNIEPLVALYNCGAGEKEGKLFFTSNFDTMNHVVSDPATRGEESIQVDIVTLDSVLQNDIPALIKIDAEGFEMSVLKGGSHILENPLLLGLIIELNGSCHRYGIEEKDIHQLLVSFGFMPVSYFPFERKLAKLDSFKLNGNTIYIRNEQSIRERLMQARKFQVLKHAI